MPAMFDAIELRVLGTMIEKKLTVPDSYPLTVNTLLSGCNQLSNRDPVMALSEADVVDALHRLRERALVGLVAGSAARVPKYTVLMAEKFGLAPPELAVLVELMLRGPQTPGELRQRADRLHAFAALADVEAVLEALAALVPPLVRVLPREPGARAVKWQHRLASDEAGQAPQAAAAGAAPTAAARIEALEARVAALEESLGRLRAQLGA